MPALITVKTVQKGQNGWMDMSQHAAFSGSEVAGILMTLKKAAQQVCVSRMPLVPPEQAGAPKKRGAYLTFALKTSKDGLSFLIYVGLGD